MQFRRQVFLNSIKVSDLLIMLVAFGFATLLTFGSGGLSSIGEFFGLRIKLLNVAIFAGFLLLWYTVFSMSNLYDSKRLSSPWQESLDIAKATSIGTLLITGPAVLFKIEMITQPFLMFFWFSCIILAVGTRLILRFILARMRKHGRNLRRILVAGTNHRALRFAQEIEKRPELGYRLIGFMDVDWEGNPEVRQSKYKVVTDFKSFPSFLREHIIDEVVIGLPLASYYKQASDVVALCEEQGILVRVLGSIFTAKLASTNAEQFGNHSVLTLHSGPSMGPRFLVKRVIDIVITLPTLIALIPVFLGIYLAVKFTSEGPAFFIQERVGLNKRRFHLFKFRTMVNDAEKMLHELEHLNEVNGAAFKVTNDPRITPIGKFLRKTSLDELPQLFNVLKGDMSLVGPRPLPVRDYNEFSEDWHRRRFSVLPGLTCLWQVNGRSNLPFYRWMELDMEYIDRWSIWLDLKILIKTVPTVLRGEGAA